MKIFSRLECIRLTMRCQWYGKVDSKKDYVDSVLIDNLTNAPVGRMNRIILTPLSGLRFLPTKLYDVLLFPLLQIVNHRFADADGAFHFTDFLVKIGLAREFQFAWERIMGISFQSFRGGNFLML